MFIRTRGGSHALIKTYRDGGKVRHRTIANLGAWDEPEKALDDWDARTCSSRCACRIPLSSGS